MARPKSKKELLKLAQDNFERMINLVDSLTYEQKINEFIFEDRDRNIKDIYIHLYEWHMLLINWIRSNQESKEKSFLPEGYNWKTYPKMNEMFTKKHINTKYEESLYLLKNSHKEVMMIIKEFSEEELFTKKYYKWTNTTSLASYIISSTSSHYDWAIKKIKKHIRSIK